MLPFSIEHQIHGRVNQLRDEAKSVRKRRRNHRRHPLATFLHTVADRLELATPTGAVVRQGA